MQTKYPDRPIKSWLAYRRPPRGLRRSLYLPRSCKRAEEFIRRGLVKDALKELEQSANMGMTEARVVLAFLHLQGAAGTGSDLDRAAALLEEPLAAGDAYAQFVMGWVHLLRDKQARPAGLLWIASAKQGFGPSYMTLARFHLTNFPDKPPDASAALLFFEGARLAGHRLAAVSIALLRVRSSSNSFSRLLALSRLPFLWLRFYLSMRADMFSDCVFVRDSPEEGPIFRNAV